MAEETDDLRGEIAKHLSDMEAPEAPVAEAPEAPEAPEPDGRPRNADGTFAKAEPVEDKGKRETLTLKTPPAPESPIPPGAAQPSPVQAQPVAPEKIAAPQEWSGLAKVKWDKLPAAVQQEIVQRETQRMAATQDLMPVKELVDVNREFLVNQAGSVPEAMRQMMQFARMSVDNPVQLAEHILRSKGIDPRTAFSGQPQGAQPQQPQDIQSLVAQLVEQRLQPFQAQAEQQQTQQLEATINQFSADPKRPFFNDVRVHMGQLIQAGTAKSLEEAYEQATWANPTIRAHLLEEQREATEKANAAQVQKARQAQRASVTGSPLEGAQPAGGRSKGNVRDVVAQLYDDLSGA